MIRLSPKELFELVSSGKIPNKSAISLESGGVSHPGIVVYKKGDTWAYFLSDAPMFGGSKSFDVELSPSRNGYSYSWALSPSSLDYSCAWIDADIFTCKKKVKEQSPSDLFIMDYDGDFIKINQNN